MNAMVIRLLLLVDEDDCAGRGADNKQHDVANNSIKKQLLENIEKTRHESKAKRVHFEGELTH